jgi:Exo-beta-D-glucosaminidase Ig-fold domain/F5/8 type C domain/Glycosyl hydrolases family 2/Glycosyl hydrolases family 2, sugar binding domain
MHRTLFVGLVAVMALSAQPYTRGVGVYPGDPREDFAATLVGGGQQYRNLALHRPAYQSSAYDYNLTAQLVTDGIKEMKLPRWVVASTSGQGVLPKADREHLLDHNVQTTVTLNGSTAWIQLEMAGGDVPLDFDMVELTALRVGSDAQKPAGWQIVVTGSDDGQNWTELGRTVSTERPPAGVRGSVQAGVPPQPVYFVTVNPTAHSRRVRIELSAPSATRWTVGEVALKFKGERVEAGGPYHFTSAWMSAGTGEEWVYVDLGAVSTFDRVAMQWIRPPSEGSIQVSDDARTWKVVRQALSPANSDIKFPQPQRGRYVRLLLTKASAPEGYILSELEVWGRGGIVAKPQAAAVAANGKLKLSAGGWRIRRDSQVTADGATLSHVGFDDKEWLPATVPGTVLSSYFDDGAIPDPNFSNNQLAISDSFFYADFWYRNEFTAPALAAGQRAWLNFNGVNWKAEVFLNGEQIGRIDGGFMRGRFDVTGKIKPGQNNALAVRVIKNATPGSVKEKTAARPDLNGGALGADNPTYHATIGWDWIPTVRGRDIGIWGEVTLAATGAVTIENPSVISTMALPDTSKATVGISATLRNNGTEPVTGTLYGRFGESTFETGVTVEAGATKTVQLNQLQVDNPKLWWPSGYGEQNLYQVELSFMLAPVDRPLYRVGRTSDTVHFQAGIRQFTYSEDGGALRMWINGRRFIPRGGNWGFPESMLRYRAREYDTAVRYHKDMNFNMIRNWVGQTGDDEFYDACDKYGIVVWQDSWLANPVDGPNPDDNALFLKNAEDFILRIRTHPSIGIYVGRNEGDPPPPLNQPLKKLTESLHPGMYYIASSADGPVSGHGPYRTQFPKFYFEQRATTKLHSELGMPNVVTLDSLKQMMRPEEMWPIGEVWGIHDFTATGAQGAAAWKDEIEKSYGGAKNAEEFVELSQFIDYDGYRAMFEAQGKNRMGLLLWMTHSCWPSFVWQTYDYYFDQSGGYFGSKKGSEPLHIQWNQATDQIEVVNYSGGNATGLTATAEILNMDGSKQWEKTATLDSPEDSVQEAIKLEAPAGLSPVHFVRLKLTRGGSVVSDNFYLRGGEENNFTAIRSLPKVQVKAETTMMRRGSAWVLTTDLRNDSKTPALMVRVKAVREKSGDRILPALYRDNYVALMPGERRTIRTELENADTRGERPRIAVEGFNIEERP